MEIVTPSDFRNAPPKKPRRSARPCDACRKRKTRCLPSTRDGSGGRCIHCDLRDTTCTFRQGPPQRFINTDTMDSTADDEEGLSEVMPASITRHEEDQQQQQQQQQAVSVTGAAVHHAQTQPISSPAGGRQHLSPGTLSPGDHNNSNNNNNPDVHHLARSISSGQHSVAATTQLRRDTRVEPSLTEHQQPSSRSSLFPSSMPPLGLAKHHFAELYGLGSDMEPILMRYRPYDPRTQEYNLETHAIRRVLERDRGQQYPLTFHMASDHKAVGHELAHSEGDAIEQLVAPHGPLLVDLFWRNVQPAYPILDKETFTRAYERSHRAISSALLGAVYLSALRWWSYDPELSARTPPDSSVLRRMVLGAIQNSYHRPKLSSIQASLLLLQCQPEDPLNPDHTSDWGLTCQALAIAQCIGLHLDCSDWSIPPTERNVRRRLSWALFMQDRWTALAYGRPVHIHQDDWTVSDLTNADFADLEAQGQVAADERRTMTATGKQQFIHMVRLTQILSGVLSGFYTATSSRETNTVLLYQRAIPVLDALDTWSRGIPSSLGMHIIYQRRLSFHGYLHSSLYGVEMALLRRLIRSSALESPRVNPDVLGVIRQRALELTQKATAFVAALRPDHLEAFWYFTSPYLFSVLGSFITLLLVTSLSSQERSFWQETLNSYLWTLRTMSKSCEPMQFAANRLEGAILRGLEHALAVNLGEPQDDTVISHPPVANVNNGGGGSGGNEVVEFWDFGDWDLLAADGDGGSFDWLHMAAANGGGQGQGQPGSGAFMSPETLM